MYCLMLEETQRKADRRTEVDALLDSYTSSNAGGAPDRATWGKLPHHQRAMRAATEAGGNVGKG
jgi:hypothetical protein